MRQRLPLILSITALVVALLGWTGVGEATRNALVPKNSAGSLQIKNGSVQYKDLSRLTKQRLVRAAWKGVPSDFEFQQLEDTVERLCSSFSGAVDSNGNPVRC